MDGPYHCCGGPNPYTAACPGVGFPTLSGEAGVEVFTRDLCLVSQQSSHCEN